MWLFRSSVNHKTPTGEDGGGDGQKAALAALWQVTAAPADAWAEKFLRKRFF